MDQPLTGLTVIDFSTLLPGPLATLLLAEAGATVIKVEKPGGEDMRRFPPFLSAHGAAYHLLNNGKAIVELDLKTEGGKSEALRLIQTADVLVEQFRPGVMARLGLDHAAVRAANERLIYCSITGYGQSGPRALQAGHDVNYLGNTGLLAQSWGDAQKPVLPPTQIADIGGGSFPAVINILLALLQRERTGQGCHIDIAMADAMFTFSVFAQAFASAGKPVPRKAAGLLTGGSPRYNIYPARCGSPICVGALEDHFWHRLCDVLDIEAADRDGRNPPADVQARLAAAFRTRTAEEWTPLLQEADCCATVMVDVVEAMADPHFRARGLFDRQLEDVEGFLPALPVPVASNFRKSSDRRAKV